MVKERQWNPSFAPCIFFANTLWMSIAQWILVFCCTETPQLLRIPEMDSKVDGASANPSSKLEQLKKQVRLVWSQKDKIFTEVWKAFPANDKAKFSAACESVRD